MFSLVRNGSDQRGWNLVCEGKKVANGKVINIKVEPISVDECLKQSVSIDAHVIVTGIEINGECKPPHPWLLLVYPPQTTFDCYKAPIEGLDNSVIDPSSLELWQNKQNIYLEKPR